MVRPHAPPPMAAPTAAGSFAKYLAHLGRERTAPTKMILSNADRIAEALKLNGELLDSLWVRLGVPA